VRPPERSRDYSVFGFMTNEVSAEVNKTIAVAGTAREMRRAREAGERIVALREAGVTNVSLGGALGDDPCEAIRLVGEVIAPMCRRV